MATKSEFILSQRLSDETASQLASRLNAPLTVPNPVPQKQIQDWPEIDDFLGLMTVAEVYAVANSIIYGRLDEALDNKDRKLSKRFVRAMRAGNLISVATHDALILRLDKDRADPAWQPTIQSSLAQQNGFTITVDDVARAIGGTLP
jgi:hypothetical protein